MHPNHSTDLWRQYIFIHLNVMMVLLAASTLLTTRVWLKLSISLVASGFMYCFINNYRSDFREGDETSKGGGAVAGTQRSLNACTWPALIRIKSNGYFISFFLTLGAMFIQYDTEFGAGAEGMGYMTVAVIDLGVYLLGGLLLLKSIRFILRSMVQGFTSFLKAGQQDAHVASGSQEAVSTEAAEETVAGRPSQAVRSLESSGIQHNTPHSLSPACVHIFSLNTSFHSDLCAVAGS